MEQGDDIKGIENSIVSSKENLNNLDSLIELLNEKSEDVMYAAMKSLYRVFNNFMNNGDLSHFGNIVQPTKKLKGSKSVQAKKTVEGWIKIRYQSYIDKLKLFIHHKDPLLQINAMNILLQLELDISKARAKEFGTDARFEDVLFPEILGNIITCSNLSDELFQQFIDYYINKYDDIRYFTLQNIRSIIVAKFDTRSKKKKNNGKN